MAFGAFPQTELNAAGSVEVVDTGSDCVPVEGYFVGIAAEYIGDIRLHVKEYIHDGVTG